MFIRILAFSSLLCNKVNIGTTTSNVVFDKKDNDFILNGQELHYTKVINDFIFSVDAISDKHIIKSKFEVYDKTSKNLICNLNYEIDLEINHYKLFQSDNVIALAKKLNDNSKLSLSQLKEIYTEIGFFMQKLKSKVQNNYNAMLTNSVPYQAAIIATLIRKKESGDYCECTTHPAYLIDKSMFVCIEDQIMKSDTLKNIVNSKGYTDSFKNNKEAMDFASYLNSINKPSISALEILEHYVSKKDFVKYLTFLRETKMPTIDTPTASPKSFSFILFLNKPKDVIRSGLFLMDLAPQINTVGSQIVQNAYSSPNSPIEADFDYNRGNNYYGSTHGCCGNYNTACLYANYICYTHDRLCTDCLNQFGWYVNNIVCFPGCVPDNY